MAKNNGKTTIERITVEQFIWLYNKFIESGDGNDFQTFLLNSEYTTNDGKEFDFSKIKEDEVITKSQNYKYDEVLKALDDLEDRGLIKNPRHARLTILKQVNGAPQVQPDKKPFTESEFPITKSKLADAIKNGDDSYIFSNDAEALLTPILENYDTLKNLPGGKSVVDAFVSKIIVHLVNTGKSLNLSIEKAAELMEKFNLYLEEPKVEKSRFPRAISILKNVVTPIVATAVFSTLLGASFSWAGTLAGENAMVTADVLGNVLSAATIGGAIGAGVSTPTVVGIYFGTRKKLAKKYGRENTNNYDALLNGKKETVEGKETFNELNFENTSVSVDDQIKALKLPICEMLDKIRNTRLDLIAEEKNKNIFKKVWNYGRRKNNRNREHEVVHFVQDLKAKYQDPSTDDKDRKKYGALISHIVKHIEECFEDNLKHVIEKKANGEGYKKNGKVNKNVNLVRDMDILSQVIDIAADTGKVKFKDKTKVAVEQRTDVVKEMSKHYTLKVLCGENYTKEIGSALFTEEDVNVIDDNTKQTNLLVKLNRINTTKKADEVPNTEEDKKAKEEALKAQKEKEALEAELAAKKAEEERKAAEETKKAEEQKAKKTAERKAKAQAKKQAEEERKAAKEAAEKAEAERKAAEEKASIEAEAKRKADEETKKAEEARKAAEEKAEEATKKLEQLEQEKNERDAKAKAAQEKAKFTRENGGLNTIFTRIDQSGLSAKEKKRLIEIRNNYRYLETVIYNIDSKPDDVAKLGLDKKVIKVITDKIAESFVKLQLAVDEKQPIPDAYKPRDEKYIDAIESIRELSDNLNFGERK